MLFRSTIAHSHAFVIFDPDIEQIASDKNPLEALACSRKGVLVDPFFNLVCPTAEVAGTPFEIYLKNNRINQIHIDEDVPSYSQGAMASLEEIADKIYNLAVAQLKDPKRVSSERNRIKEAFLVDARRAELAMLFPDIKWKGARNMTLWRRTSLEEGRQLCHAINGYYHLNLELQQVKGELGSYVVAIDRKALLSMRRRD